MICGTIHSSSSRRSHFHCAETQAVEGEAVRCTGGLAWAILLPQNHRVRAGPCQVKELEAIRAI